MTTPPAGEPGHDDASTPSDPGKLHPDQGSASPDTAAGEADGPDPHDQLAELAMDDSNAWVTAIREVFETHAPDPEKWPAMAANFHLLGERLTRHGIALADALAAYSTEHPQVEVSPTGVPVVLLPVRAHENLWDAAAELADPGADGPGDGTWPTIADYAKAVLTEHGRPELDARAVPIPTPDQDDTNGVPDAVLVLVHLAGAPEQVVQCHVGTHENPDGEAFSTALAAVLDEQGITPGPPRFWPPLNPEARFLSLYEGVFDVYGRRVEVPGDTQDEAPEPGREADDDAHDR